MSQKGAHTHSTHTRAYKPCTHACTAHTHAPYAHVYHAHSTHRHTHITLVSLLNLCLQPAYPNGPYTLLKIYSYKLHCQSGLGPGARRDHGEEWPLSCSLGSHLCTQTQHHPGAKMAGLEGLKGPASWAGGGARLDGWGGDGVHREGPHRLVLQVRRQEVDLVPLFLFIYRYLQKKVMSNRPQSCKRNAPPPSLPPNEPPAHPRTP